MTQLDTGEPRQLLDVERVRELFDPTRAVRRGAACPVLSVHQPRRGRRTAAGADGTARSHRREALA